MYISLFAVAINVALKIVLFKPYGAAGLAMATAVGAWLNFLLLIGIAFWQGAMKPTLSLGQTVACVSVASFALSVFAVFAGKGRRLWRSRSAILVMSCRLCLSGQAVELFTCSFSARARQSMGSCRHLAF